MKFKSFSIPPISVGEAGGRRRQTVPNQAMSLEEILQRFVRNEPLPIGRDALYHEGEDDLSKLDDLDLTEKKEYADKQRQVQREYKEQERIKREKAKAKLEAEEREKIAAKLAAESKSPENRAQNAE